MKFVRTDEAVRGRGATFDSMIEAHALTKDYGSKRAVDELRFAVRPGIVTGFLGPNGSGKSTTMRMILGLDAPTGTVTVNGKRYREHKAPLHEVGALLEARSVHTGRSAYHHLLALARRTASRAPRRRADRPGRAARGGAQAGRPVLAGHGPAPRDRGRAARGSSTLMLDEPVNGLDPEGIHWIRNLLRSLAAEGRTVFVSSHLMAEMALTADHLIVIGRGRLIADTSVEEFVRRASGSVVRVRAPEATRLRELLLGADVSVTSPEAGVLDIEGVTAQHVGETAAANAIVLHELMPLQASLEEAFMELTRDDVEYRQARPDRRRAEEVAA